MKKTIRVKFLDFAKVHPLSRWPYYELLTKHYDVCECDNPDYVIDLGDQFHHHWYDHCVKILFEQENNHADFNTHDYVVGFDDLSFGDRYLRIPLFARWPSWYEYVNRPILTDEELLGRKFCSIVVSNGWMGESVRRDFFQKLSKYKPVASGGRWNNTVGGPVTNKVDFCRQYKFHLAFENAAGVGYTTEKILDAFAASAVPVYYGNPRIADDCNLQSMVCVKSADDVERAIEEIVALDRDDDAYLRKVKEYPFAESDVSVYFKRMETFLCNIFDQPLVDAYRRNRTGFQPLMQQHFSKIKRIDYRLIRIRDRIKSLISFAKS